MTQRQIKKHYKQLLDEPVEHAIVNLTADYKVWNVIIDTSSNEFFPYNGGKFWVEIKFRDGFPMEKPYIKMITPIYHINITQLGVILIPIFYVYGWSPTFRTRDVIQQIVQLLMKSNAENATLTDYATETKLIQYYENIDLFNVYAMEYTKQYATKEPTNKNNYKNQFIEPNIVEWNKIRQIWIGFYKNNKNINCFIHLLPKDIVKYIIKLVAIYVV